MSLKGLIIDLMMRKKGILYVDTLKSKRYSDVYYCVDVETDKYSFWKWSGWHEPVLISDNLSREDAAFKLTIMGG